MMPLWLSITLIVLGSLVLLILILFLIVELGYLKIFFKRGDGINCIDYYSPKEFKELSYEKIHFNSGKYQLTGFVYKNSKIKKYKAVVLVNHGIGFGHRYLLSLIEKIASDGFIVVAYDFTASGISEGKRIKSMTQALLDNKAFFSYLSTREDLKKYPLYLVGHSWGGYASLASLNLDVKIDKVISFAGFSNELDLFTSTLKPIKILKPIFLLRNYIHYGEYSLMSGLKGVQSSSAKILYIQGEEDKVVSPAIGANLLSKVSNKNLQIKLLPNKGHSCFFTPESEKKALEVLSQFGMFSSKAYDPHLSIDYRKISRIDPDIVSLVLDFLNN